MKAFLKKIPVHWYMIGISLCLMMPILVTAAFTHPWWDDYMYMADTRASFQSGGIFAVIPAAVRTASSYYVNWSGAYSHQFFAALSPSLISYDLYKPAMVVSALFFVFSVYYLSFTLSKIFPEFSKNLAIALGSAVLVLTSYFMPSATQFFFWYAGACNYAWVICSLTLCAAFALRLFHNTSRKMRIVYAILIAAGLVYIGGCNQSTALFTVEISVLTAFLIHILNKKDKRKILYFYCFAVISALALLANILAPGNQVRIETENHLSTVPKAIINSFTYMTKSYLNWTSVIPVICLLLLAPFIYNYAKKLKFRFPQPILVLVCTFLLLTSLHVPVYYALNYAGPGRLRDCIYYLYLCGFFGNAIYLIGWFAHKYDFSFEKRQIALYISAITVVAILLFPMDAVMNSNGVVCIKQLKSGHIQAYDQKMQEFHDTIVNSPDAVVRVPEVTQSPITRVSRDWNDEARSVTAHFYGKQNIIIEK